MVISGKPRYIDLFAGCGGISLGLFNAGWQGIFAIEKSEMAFKTLKHNLIEKNNHYDWPDWLPLKEHDVSDVLTSHKEELVKLRGNIDLITGGPPCQGFSFAGRRNAKDKRNELFKSYIKFIELIQPKILFLENVKGFTIGFKNEGNRDEAYSERVSKKLDALGYSITHKMIDFSNYGIPQHRKRFILVGVLEGDPEVFFERTVKIKETFLKNNGLNDYVTLEEAISDLKKEHGTINSNEYKGFKEGLYGEPNSDYQKIMRKDWNSVFPDSHRFTNHRKKTIERFKYVLKNCQKGIDINVDVKKQFNLKKHTIIPLDKDSPSATLTTLPDDYIHYSEPRILTVREYARIQSFSDWFEFKSKYTTGSKYRRYEVPRYTQVGNAVPPLYSELSGRVFMEMV